MSGITTSMKKMKKLEKIRKKVLAEEREKKIKLAIEEVLRGKPNQRAAKEYEIPDQTLRDRVAKARKHIYGRKKCDHFRLFTDAQEDMLKEHCLWLASIGYGMAEWQILDMARQMSFVLGKQVPSRSWFYQGFLPRHPDVAMSRPQKRDKGRAKFTQEVGDKYFEELGKRLDELAIKNVMHRNYNMDETGVSLDHNPPKVLNFAHERAKMVTHGHSPNTTLLSCVNAAGESLPPYIVVKGQKVPQLMKVGAKPGTVFTSSESGWTNSLIFKDWFHNHFKRHIPAERPVILFYDGHTTHYSADIIASAMLEGIHLFVLPPHSSHATQPLDKCVFGPFKKQLYTGIHKWMNDHKYKTVTKEDLPILIR